MHRGRAASLGFGLAAISWVALLAAQAPPSPPNAPAISFSKDIFPVLDANCLTCHGEGLQLSKLDLRTRDGALKGGDHGAAIVPGNAEQSRLYRLITGLEKPSMPLDGPSLPAEDIAKIKLWIEQGAQWDTPAATSAPSPAAGPSSTLAALENMQITPQQRNYWAFKLPVQAPLPRVTSRAFENPVDLFLERVREDKGLKAAPRADRKTLIRRAYLDLLGLPPSPEEVEAFVADPSPTAWEQLIDRLLESPHYGERWGRHWLDVARYADSTGFEQDYERKNAWRYRDYVIRSFNQDKPYNVFIKEQIAGDEIDWRTYDTLIATGFLRAGPRVAFREKDNPERRHEYLDDVIATISRGMLGLTVNCARCHNHKFDPIPQKDYYALEAAIYGYVETEVPLAPRAQAEAYTARNAEIDAKLQPLRDALKTLEEPVRQKLELQQILATYPENVRQAVLKPENQRSAGEKLLVTQVEAGVSVRSADIDKVLSPDELARKRTLAAQIAEIEKQRPAPLPMAEIVTDGDYRFAPLGEGDEVVSCPKCRIPPDFPGSYLHTGPDRYVTPPSYFLIGGDPNSHGSLMKPGFVTVATYGNPPTELPPADGRTSGRRRALAEWIGSAENPLTARVLVNRVWARHFGRGIVATLDNFGKMGEQPTHQDLLDWMAVEFMNHGWSIKNLHRLMMTSEAYQMASAFDSGADTAKDPENMYLWRFRPQRLEAEIIRDNILAVSGGIDLKMGGPAIFPFVPKDILESEKIKGTWRNQEDGPAVWRRSIYVFQRRSLPFPMFETFDHPDMNVSSAQRNISTVPTQALTLLNNPFVLRQAEVFADRVRKLEPADPARQVDAAYRLALSRPATPAEITIGADLIKNQSLVDFTHVVLNLSEFLYMR